MRRTLLLLGAAASAAAFSASPMSLRGSAPARAVSRSGATAVKMDVDPSLIIATLPGLAALGLSLQSAQGLYLSQPLALLLPLSRMRVLRLSHSGFLWRDFTRLLDCSLALSGALFLTLPRFPSFSFSLFISLFLFLFPATADTRNRALTHASHAFTGNMVGGASAVAAPPAPVMAPVDMLPTARANFNRWNSALQTKNPTTVAALYSTAELSFLPTVSPQHIKGYSNTEDYFKDFVLKNPFGTITDDSVQVFDGGKAYLHSGMYTFELGDAGSRTPVQARFSYVWRSYNGDWKITHHHSSVTPAGPDMVKVARDNFQKWNDALQTKNNKLVASLYSKTDLSFLPTVSPQHIKAISNTEEYFKDFVQKNPFGTITDDKVQVFDGGKAYLHSGMYTFELGDAGSRTPVQARFSYVWRKEDGEWKIAHHHSSVTPAGAAK